MSLSGDVFSKHALRATLLSCLLLVSDGNHLETDCYAQSREEPGDTI